MRRQNLGILVLFILPLLLAPIAHAETSSQSLFPLPLESDIAAIWESGLVKSERGPESFLSTSMQGVTIRKFYGVGFYIKEIPRLLNQVNDFLRLPVEQQRTIAIGTLKDEKVDPRGAEVINAHLNLLMQKVMYLALATENVLKSPAAIETYLGRNQFTFMTDDYHREFFETGEESNLRIDDVNLFSWTGGSTTPGSGWVGGASFVIPVKHPLLRPVPGNPGKIRSRNFDWYYRWHYQAQKTKVLELARDLIANLKRFRNCRVGPTDQFCSSEDLIKGFSQARLVIEKQMQAKSFSSKEVVFANYKSVISAIARNGAGGKQPLLPRPELAEAEGALREVGLSDAEIDNLRREELRQAGRSERDLKIIDLALKLGGFEDSSRDWIRLSKDRSTLVMKTSRDRLEVFETQGLQAICVIQDSAPVSVFELSPDESTIWVGFENEIVAAYQARTCKLLARVPSGYSTLQRFQISKDGKSAVAFHVYDKAVVYQLDSAKPLAEIEISFSQDENFFLSQSLNSWVFRNKDQQVEILNLRAAKRQLVWEDPVDSVQLTPDGRFALVSANDTKVVSLENPGKVIKTFNIRRSPQRNVRLTPDGNYYLTISYDGAYAIDLRSMSAQRIFNTFPSSECSVSGVAQIQSIEIGPRGEVIAQWGCHHTQFFWPSDLTRPFSEMPAGVGPAALWFTRDGKYMIARNQNLRAYEFGNWENSFVVKSVEDRDILRAQTALLMDPLEHLEFWLAR